METAKASSARVLSAGSSPATGEAAARSGSAATAVEAYPTVGSRWYCSAGWRAAGRYRRVTALVAPKRVLKGWTRRPTGLSPTVEPRWAGTPR